MSIQQKKCNHLPSENQLLPTKDVCEECEKTGSRWVHLRTCQTCGVTLCCDSSPKQHATAHFKATGHPVVISAEPDEHWMWCYKDELFYRY